MGDGYWTANKILFFLEFLKGNKNKYKQERK